MEARDLDLRNRTYRFMAEVGRAPSAEEIALATGADPSEISAAWRRLHDAHALVLDEHGGIRMLNPFSAEPTGFRVEASGRSWFANCGWDAFGIGAALGVDSLIETECADCREPILITVRERHPDPPDLLWHVLVPAREWWRDIGYT